MFRYPQRLMYLGIVLKAILGGRKRNLHLVISRTCRSQRNHADRRCELIADSVGTLAEQ
jgi:hypothetical protein